MYAYNCCGFLKPMVLGKKNKDNKIRIKIPLYAYFLEKPKKENFVSYFRKMIYLQEEGQECGGYIKASGKREWIRLEIHLKNVKKWENLPVTIVLNGQDGAYNQLAGVVSGEEITRLESKTEEKDEVIGIWIGENGKPQMGEGQPPAAESEPSVEENEPSVQEKTEEAAVVAEPVQKQQEKIPETTEPEIETAETEPPEFIEVEMEEEHDWKYECDKLFSTHTAMYPFSDDEVDQCVQIGTEDFGEFPQRYWTLSENPFLKQGLYNFGHLLFAGIGDRVFVGVPGRYHKRDVYLGRTYGFSHFKSIHKSKLKMGDFGYWMMEVHPQPLQAMQGGWEAASDIKEKSSTSGSNIPPEGDTQASAGRP